MDKDKILDSVDETIDEIYVSLKYSFRDITVFPGEELRYPAMISALITFISLVSWLFGVVRFTHWVGALIGTIILAILYYVGKEAKDDEELGSIRTSEGDIESHASGEATTGEERKVSRREDYAELINNSVRIETEDDNHN